MNQFSVISFCILFIALFAHAEAYITAIDSASPVSESNFECFYQQGSSTFIAPLFISGAIQAQAVTNIKNSQKSKVKCDVIINGNNKQAALDIIKTVNKAVTRTYFRKVWIGIFKSEEWKDEDSNCKQLEELVYQGQQYFGNYIGIFSTREDWNNILGSSCNKFGIYPVWYQNTNGIASMTDWSNVSFGGWRKPTMKQYLERSQLCGVNVNFDYENSSAEQEELKQ